MNDQVEAEFGGVAIAEVDHLLEFVRRIYMQKGKGHRARKKGFLSEAEKDGGVFTDRVKQHGALAFGDDFSHDMNALRFKLLEMTAGGH